MRQKLYALTLSFTRRFQMKNRLVPVVLAVCAAVSLSACTPPMPPEFKADLAEKYVTCVDGPVTVSAPLELTDIAQQWVDGYQESCPGSAPSLVDAAAPADVRLAASGTALDCAVSVSAPVVLDAAVVAISNQDLAGIILSPEVLYQMITGQITSLGDAAIQDINPDLELTDTPFTFSLNARQQEIDALGTWMNRIDPAGWPSTPTNLAAVPVLDDAALTTAFEADGTVAIVPLSYALLNSFPTANIQSDEVAVSDGDSLISASTQLLAQVNNSVVSAALDPSVAPDPAAGTSTVIPPYQALTLYSLSGCGGATEQSQRAFIRYALRLDSQGVVTTAGLTAVPEALRQDATTAVSQGLPEATAQPTEVAIPSEEPVEEMPSDMPSQEATADATDIATPEPSQS